MECNTEDGNEWTAYFDVDGDQLNGESESLYLHRVNNPELNICKYPSAVQARQTNNPTEGIEDQRDQIDISPAGLFCTNEPHSKCKDYQVRYCCAKRFLQPTCAAGSQWTAYTSNDTPDGPGDIEVSIPCSSPSSIQARLVDNQAPYQTGEDFVLLSPTGGLTCLNDQQLDGECNNYEVRFCCPE
ncbi:hypothetical protein SNE40_005148 [Patella caerulea]|uniref:WxxW domain-containing protein n=1 Tax=Patella caerulea TaxID=87958 RepID=A0AAN8K702_PATCE